MNSAGKNSIPENLHGGYAPWFSSRVPPPRELRITARPFQFVEHVSGVNVMRHARCSLLMEYAGATTIDDLNRLFRPESVIASASVAAESEPVIELSTMSTIALLRMNRSTLCRGIATHLQNDCQDTPSRFDYVPLVAHGLARQPAEGERWHSITPKGMTHANELARAKAKELGIHILIEGTHHGALASYSCSCGNWRGSYQRGQFTQRNALFRWSRHAALASPTAQAESA